MKANEGSLTVARIHPHPHAHAGPSHPHAVPGWSLLRLSFAARLAIAGVVVAAIWAAVGWAIA